jgi:FAD/FMN-containing dehydrogenase
MLDSSQLETLRQIAGHENVLNDAEAFEKYGQDWTRFFSPSPSAIVFARDSSQLQNIVRYACQENLPLVPSGGRTGMSGGAVAIKGEIVVSFEKMNKILSFNEIDQTVTLEPGVITQTLQEYALDQNLYYPVDFASSGSSQIGGNIATNAGGIKVLRYGLSRDWVAGLKVITGTGEELELNQSLVKNATGYDLRHLFIGSEGTLGFIVEATIKLTKQPEHLKVTLLAVPEMTDVISILTEFRKEVSLTAFEFFSEKALLHVLARTDAVRPFEEPSAYYVLLEYELGDEVGEDAAMNAFEACAAAGWVVDGVVGSSEQQNQNLWRYREAISESITPYTPYKNDISVRVSQVPEFLKVVEDTVVESYPEFEIVWFGHIGDGNLHLNILKPESLSIDDFKQECESVSESVLGIVADFKGSISAEHGVGLLKRDQLHYTRPEHEIELMRSLKQVFDPNGILNPGKLLPPTT